MKKHGRFKALLSVILVVLMVAGSFSLLGAVSVSAGVEEGIYLRGSMNGWNCYEEYKFVDEGNGIYTLVLDMTGGNYEFKIATPTWSVSIGHPDNDDDNAFLEIEADSIMKFTADTKTKNYTVESMNTKSDFTLGNTAQTIEAENYTYALGSVNVWDASEASGGKYVGSFDEGDNLNYGVTVDSEEAKTYKFEINVSSETDDGIFDFTIGEESFRSYFTKTGAWQTYKTVVVTKTLNPGYNRITIDNLGGTYNVDKIVVTPVTEKNIITSGTTTLDFSKLAAANDKALVSGGVFKSAAAEDYASIFVKTEQDGVYKVTLDTADADIQVGDYIYDSGESIVIEGETEIIVIAEKADVTVKEITFEAINNVESMGYYIVDEEAGVVGYRFANTFAVDEITITALIDIPAGKLILSNGKEVAVEAVAEGETKSITFDTAEHITWFTYAAEDAVFSEIKVFGTKDMGSATDIALQGYVSTAYGWEWAGNYPYCTTVVSEGKLGFGFDKEVTVEEIVVIGTDDSIPTKATLTTADNKSIELTGVKQGNNVIFALEGSYSFGFFLDFGEEVTFAAIQAYGNDEYKGPSTNVSSRQDYTLFVNGLTEDDSRVIANTGDHILTSETGSDREWSYELLGAGEVPDFVAPNTPLAEAAYNLTMDEIFKSINYDETYGDVFYTGTNWHKVWTRDTAISMQYILSWLFPEISTNCANAKVVGKDGRLTFEEDTGTGGSYPVSTDRIIMMLAVWETYLADGNEETLEYFYEVAKNTIEQDYEVVYDKEAGLFRGETCGLDHRDKTYGDWTGEDDQNGIVTIAEGKAASTNIIFCQVMKILSEAATILGKGDAEAQAWADLAADLEEAISTRLWHDELGTYASWEYPDWMGSPLSYKQDVLADGYAVWYNIGGQDKADSIMENHTLVPFGANTVYPQKNAQRWTDYKYHDSGVWPGWEALLMIGAVNNENENNLLAEEIWNSCVRGAVACLTNYEVIDYETGEGLHSTQQLWSVAATMAGYYRVLFGMEYTTEGITFDPYVPEWMEGPFYLYGFEYRDAVINLELYGDGDTVESIYVNDEKVDNDYVFPTDAEGDYTIVINLKDSGAEDKINLKDENTAKAPTAPNATLSGSTLKWNAVTNCTYKVWTGSEYVDVDGTTYTIDTTKYGVYCVVAVDKTTGLWSELSAPKEYNPAGTKVTVNANNYYDKAPTTSGSVDSSDKKTVYFTNNKGWSTVNIFFWGGYVSTSWPGESMNYVGKNEMGEDVYCYSISNDTPNIIFNNGSEQTVDITSGVADNAGFYLESNASGKWTVGTWTNTEFSPADAAASGSFTVKVDIPADGVYQMSVIHSNQGDPTSGITAAIRSVYIDGEDVGTLVFPTMSYTRQISSHLRLELTKGQHEVTIKYETEKNWFDRNMSQAHGEANNNVTYHTVQFVRTGDLGEAITKELLLGDTDMDGKVNVKDATLIQKAVADLATLSDDAKLCADVDGNGNVNIKDATAIQKFVADIETGYAIGEYYTVKE